MTRTTGNFTIPLAPSKKETKQYWGRPSDAATSGDAQIVSASTDSDRDASTSGQIWTAAAATAGRNDAATTYKTDTSEIVPVLMYRIAISYTVQDASRSSEPVGGTDKGWLAKGLD